MRYLKYTPQYDFCQAVVYGTFAPQNSGIICTQSLNNSLVNFFINTTKKML